MIEAVRQALEAAGIAAVRLRPGQLGPHLRCGAVAVGLHKAEASEAGLFSYLGTVTDPERGELALYGMRLAAELELTALSPRADGAASCSALLDRVQAVLLGGVAGISLRAFSRQEACYDAVGDQFQATLVARYEAWLYATQTEDGTAFENFTLRGVIA